MDHVFVKATLDRRSNFYKLISEKTLFDPIEIDLASCIEYIPDHNLDEDSWFKINDFSKQKFYIDSLRNFDSKNYDDLTKEGFPNILFIMVCQGEDFYFQKVTKACFIKKKLIVFGDLAKIEDSDNRLVVNPIADAVYYKNDDVLIFKKLSTISSIFKGIDELYKEATQEEVEDFLEKPLITVHGSFCYEKISIPNRKRIGLVIPYLDDILKDEKDDVFDYIKEYCSSRIEFDNKQGRFQVSNNEELKLVLYGIEQRFYTTPFNSERRLANSIIPLR